MIILARMSRRVVDVVDGFSPCLVLSWNHDEGSLLATKEALASVALSGMGGRSMGWVSRRLANVQQALALLRTLLLIGVLGGILIAGYWVYQLWNEQSFYERYLHNLLGERRVAEIC